jgi:hypothetical protein
MSASSLQTARCSRLALKTAPLRCGPSGLVRRTRPSKVIRGTSRIWPSAQAGDGLPASAPTPPYASGTRHPSLPPQPIPMLAPRSTAWRGFHLGGDVRHGVDERPGARLDQRTRRAQLELPSRTGHPRVRTFARWPADRWRPIIRGTHLCNHRHIGQAPAPGRVGQGGLVPTHAAQTRVLA